MNEQDSTPSLCPHGNGDRTQCVPCVVATFMEDMQKERAKLQAERDEILTRDGELYERTRAAERERDLALGWSEDDKPIPEDSAIHAAHPARTGKHELYAEAMRLVGAKRSKGALVSLVTWLLHERDEFKAEAARWRVSQEAAVEIGGKYRQELDEAVRRHWHDTQVVLEEMRGVAANRAVHVAHAVLTNDKLITCIACGRDGCEREVTLLVDTYAGARKRVTVGLHERCGILTDAPAARGDGGDVLWWKRQQEKVLVHDDGCGEVLDGSGFCPKCKFHPDMQSTAFRTNPKR